MSRTTGLTIRHLTYCGASLAALALLQMPAFAQASAGADAGDDTIVVTAARGVARDLSSLPLSISVLDQEAIQTQVGVQANLSRSLSLTTPGFNFIGDSLYSGGSIGARLRGRDTLTVVNGIPINTLFYSGGVDLGNFDPEAIGRVEVVRSASAAYGFGANGGIIAVTTKRPTEDGLSATSKIATEIMTENSNDNVSLFAYQDIMGKSDKGSYRIGVSYRGMGTSYSARGQAIPSDFSNYNKSSINIDAYGELNLTDEQSIEVTGNYFRQKWDSTQYATAEGTCVPTLAAPDGNAQPCLTEQRPSTDVLSGPSIGAGSLAKPRQTFYLGGITYRHENVLGSALSMQLFHANLDWVFTGFAYEQETFLDREGNPIADLLFAGQLITKEERTGFRASMDTPLSDSGARVLWGYDFLDYQNTNDVANGTIPVEDDPEVFITGKIKQRSHALYAQGEFPVGALVFSAGVRREWIRANIDSYLKEDPYLTPFEGGRLRYGATTFNGGVVWKVRQGIEVYAGFSQGYDVTDLARGSFVVPNAASLEPAPAKATIYEAGLRYRGGIINATLAGFYSDSKNGNTFVARVNEAGELLSGTVIRQPRRIWGGEATVDVRATPELTLGGTIGIQEGRTDDENGNSIPLDNGNIAPTKVTGYVEYAATDWLNLRTQAIYTGKRTIRGAPVNEFNLGPIDSIFVMDASAQLTFDKHRISISVANLFNNFYFAPVVQAANFEGCCLNPALGRTIQVGYTINW